MKPVLIFFGFVIAYHPISFAQKKEMVKVIKLKTENKIDVFINNKPFTSFLYPDSLEKPILFPVRGADETIVTRGFPIDPRPDEPTDHPHQKGIWFTYENVNGLDFWNNSYAIPGEKKYLYGWIKTDSILKISGGLKGIIAYHANWTNQRNKVLLEENTTLTFSGTEHQRIIDRTTILKADTNINFTDAKDGLYGMRLAHELQIPNTTSESVQYANDKKIPKVSDTIANGNYITSEGKTGDAAWGTRARWCKVFAKIKNDSISIAMIDHPQNPGYPTFWHARGYGLFAANPLGEKIFTNGKSIKNFHLNKGESVTFRYRTVIDSGNKTISAKELNELADKFAKEK